MANYNLVVNSTFKPFTYEDYIKPYEAYGKAYREVEDALSELDTKASIWEGMANKETDPEAYATYSKYAEDLRNQADILATKGLNGTSRKSMLDMKKRYNSDIVPIENAYNTRKDLIDKQRAALDKDGTMLFDFDASALSLDDLIKDPTKMYKSYSGATLASQVGTVAKTLADQLRSNPGEWKEVLEKQYYELIEQRGFKPEEIMEVINSKEGGSEVLRKMVEDAVDSSGIKGWKNADVLERAYDFANQGLWNAEGKEERKQVENKSYDYAMRNWLEKEKEKREAERLKATQTGGFAVNPLNIYSTKEQGEAAKKMKDYAKYFTKDSQGNTILTEEGMKEYRREVKSNVSVAGSGGGTAALMNLETIYDRGSSYTVNKSPFRKFMDSLGVDERNGVIDNWNPVVMGSYWDKYLSNHDTAKYDATRVTEFDYTIKTADQDLWGNKILTAAGNGEIKAVDYDSKTGTFKPTGDTLDKEALKKGDIKITSTRFSPYGSTIMVQDKEGNVKRYELPRGINTINEQNRDAWMNYSKQLMSARAGGVITRPDGTKVVVTPEQVQAEYDYALQNAYMHHSQLGITNTTEPQKAHPYRY